MSSRKLLCFEKEQVVDDPLQQDLFNFAKFKDMLNIRVVKNHPLLLEMEIASIDASIVNALRRIIIAEIPTMAFHKTLLYQNTSVLPD